MGAAGNVVRHIVLTNLKLLDDPDVKAPMAQALKSARGRSPLRTKVS